MNFAAGDPFKVLEKNRDSIFYADVLMLHTLDGNVTIENDAFTPNLIFLLNKIINIHLQLLIQVNNY